MKKLLLSTATATLLAGAAFAENTMPSTTGPIFNGSVEVEIKENDAGDYGATTTIEAGVEAGLTFGSLSFESVDADSFDLDEWQIGAYIGRAAISFGDQDGVFVESWSDYSDILEPAMTESLQVSVGDIAVAVGFNDVASDISDISNIQGAYTLGLNGLDLTTSADYNFDSEEWAVGSRVEGIQLASVDLGATMSYGSDSEDLAYEVDGTVRGITGYLNGNSDDMLRNIGVGYERGFGAMTLSSDVNYDTDAEDLAPRITATFNF